MQNSVIADISLFDSLQMSANENMVVDQMAVFNSIGDMKAAITAFKRAEVTYRNAVDAAVITAEKERKRLVAALSDGLDTVRTVSAYREKDEFNRLLGELPIVSTLRPVQA